MLTIQTRQHQHRIDGDVFLTQPLQLFRALIADGIDDQAQLRAPLLLCVVHHPFQALFQFIQIQRLITAYWQQERRGQCDALLHQIGIRCERRLKKARRKALRLRRHGHLVGQAIAQHARRAQSDLMAHDLLGAAVPKACAIPSTVAIEVAVVGIATRLHRGHDGGLFHAPHIHIQPRSPTFALPPIHPQGQHRHRLILGLVSAAQHATQTGQVFAIGMQQRLYVSSQTRHRQQGIVAVAQDVILGQLAYFACQTPEHARQARQTLYPCRQLQPLPLLHFACHQMVQTQLQQALTSGLQLQQQTALVFTQAAGIGIVVRQHLFWPRKALLLLLPQLGD